MSDSQLFYEAISRFEAARRVEILPTNHRSYNLHGHSFIVRARVNGVSGNINVPGDALHKLTKRLKKCSGRLDYTLLNDAIDVPTDENLARWFYKDLKHGDIHDIHDIHNIGIQSTVDDGAYLSCDNHTHIWRRYRFEAAHQLPNVPPGHKCGQMHGHGFEVVIHANQNLAEDDPMGFDYDEIDKLWFPQKDEEKDTSLHSMLNYKCLNDIDGLRNPTSENIAAWIWEKLKNDRDFKQLSWVSVYETKSSGCHYDGKYYRIWKEQGFESALTILKTPKDNPLHYLHGHSYLIRLHLTAPLDEVMGWTVDYGDVKEKFKPIYEQIDHHKLDYLDGLTSPDLETFIHWIKDKLQPDLPELDRINLYETPGCGAILSWGEEPPVLPTKVL